ncbi:MAG: hypothetical protein JWM41_3347 [Gemmatimonadetes bacterium]|nr:hypothetical protein [Gemmatimonadota bacterium]
MLLPQGLKLLAVVLISVVAGGMNAIAGGGTLLTFPALVGLGITPIVANATSTVALWPGAVSSMWGYRGELAGARKWAIGFALPSLTGGAVGAWLLLRTPPERFAELVPWLVLGATSLFMLQPVVMKKVRERRAARLSPGASTADDASDAERTRHFPKPSILFVQFCLGIYGGYFGAGVGIMMLAILGFMGLTNIHRMNGLKNWGGLCMNFVAAAMFAFSSLVTWSVALSMAVGSIGGGYLGARAAQRVPQRYIRRAVIAIGLTGGFWLLYSAHRPGGR